MQSLLMSSVAGATALGRTRPLLARVVGGGPTFMRDVGVGYDYSKEEGRYFADRKLDRSRAGHLTSDGFNPATSSGNAFTDGMSPHYSVSHLLNNFVPQEEGYHQKRLTELPGVRFHSDLPADPITRLFFQQKGDASVYGNTYQDPNTSQDADRIEMKRRDAPHNTVTRREHTLQLTNIYDFCHRIREGSEQRKRFVMVPATDDTKGAAEVLFRHGIIAGFRDFGNKRSFAVELKYFQNEPVLQVIEPASRDARVEYTWSPKMMRRMRTSHGISNHIRIFIVRTHDGRVIDHIQATDENIGGTGLLMAF